MTRPSRAVGSADPSRLGAERPWGELYLIPHFENMPVRDITRKDVRALVRKLERRNLAAASIKSYIAPLRAMFSDAVDDGDLCSTRPYAWP